jgi:hypothetical protein
MQVAALAQRTLQERLHDLEILNEELVIAKNAMLSDLMVRLHLRDIYRAHAYHASVHITRSLVCVRDSHWW